MAKKVLANVAAKTVASTRAQPKKIVAVAIGPANKTVNIDSNAIPDGVRPYIAGLVPGLRGQGLTIGTAADYVIEYRECPATNLDSYVFNRNLRADYIFCMSTRVLKRAQAFTTTTPIIGICSNPKKEEFLDQNIVGISGRRSHIARQCYERLVQTVPSLTKVYVLHDPTYGPAVDSLKNIHDGGHGPELANVSPSNIQGVITGMTPRSGLLILPTDWFFGIAERIRDWAQATRLADFWPVTDWVKHTSPSALGGFGVSQLKCGELLAERVAAVWDGTIPTRDQFLDSNDVLWYASDAAAQDRGLTLSNHPQLKHI